MTTVPLHYDVCGDSRHRKGDVAMRPNDWFGEGFEAVEEYSRELEEKRQQFRPSVWSFILAADESATIRFLTDKPITFREHYLPNVKGRKYLTCLGRDCPMCDAGNKPSFRGAFLVIDRRTETFETREGEKRTVSNQIKIMKHGIRVCKALTHIAEARGLTNRDYDIKRTGESTDTTYTFLPGDKEPLSETDQQAIKELLERYKTDGKPAESLRDVLLGEVQPLPKEDVMTILAGGTPGRKDSHEPSSAVQSGAYDTEEEETIDF